MARPIWLLDIDGVLNTWPRTPVHAHNEFQEHVVCDLSTGKDFRLVIAQPVIDFINEMWASGDVDLRWHTTWQKSSIEVAKAFGIALDIPVQEAPEFDRWRQRTEGAGWWKMAAGQRILDSTDVPVIWTDDDLGVYWIEQMKKAGTKLDRLVKICPDPGTGLSKAHMAKIEHIIDDWKDSQ